VAKYFDKREGREKTIPDCSKHGLVWNKQTQRCEKIAGLGFMGADFYNDDYYTGGGDSGAYGGDGGYYDGGGSLDYGFDTTSWPTFDQYYGTSDIGAGGDFNYGYGFDAGLPPDYALGFGPETGFMDLGGGYAYDPSTGGVLDTGLQQPGSDLFGAFFDYYSAQGYDDYTAMQMAATDAAGGSILTETYEQAPPPILPNLPEQYFALPPPPYDYGFWAGYSPTFPEQYFPLPPPPSNTAQPNLPPYCPAGQYHPYPIGHPQQNVCVPFPTATTNVPKPPTSQPSPAPAPKPPAQQKPPTQQQCPQGYYRTSTGQCLPIPKCTTPGTVFDQARGTCVPKGQAVSPLPGEAEDFFANLKNIPWWVWLALGGAFLLSRDDGGKKTTVTYRRAR